MRSRKSLHKLKSFGFISAVIIGLLLITILVLLADKITVTDELYDLVQAHPEIAPKKPTSKYILPGLDICHKDKIFKYALTDMRVVKRFFNAHTELVEEKETIEQDAYDYDQYYDSYLFHHYDLSRHYWKFGDGNIYPSGKFFLYD
ncbi:unnamed protein product [Clavelina lepadiformis]|uniref:Uncharacterized protein n=1 Tax=Clavelina lepadiformis TaxID=159417 RepID=A0ABP0EZJ0_CLALP